MYAIPQPFLMFVEEQTAFPMLKALLLFLGGAVFGLLAGLDPAREALVCLLVSDFVLGVLHSLKLRVFSFRKFGHGLVKFLLYGVGIRIMCWVDVATGPISLPVVGEISLNALLCGWMALGEGLSCLSHLDAFGLRLPWLSERLRRYRGMIEQEEYRGPERRRLPRGQDDENDKGGNYYGR